MDCEQFRQRMMEAVPVGTVLRNPGGGTSEIISYGSKNVTYRRGRSDIGVSVAALYDAVDTFCGKKLDSGMLREYRPRVFHSKHSGHSCNCTFLFMVLKAMGVINEIEGKGVAHHPYWVRIPAWGELAEDV